ncbi:GNAT family N-acetyltransferase [Streptomyces sp. SBT349]|uniref:GNAT family N-acetyltransferase n=1 Tax=Streptomyces sp. SBT349 TaxID=1580539 RepID=UPI00066B317F|nr:GNAT family N-acetyltransferase [Streptomyces sp. SBT349]
MTTTLRPAGPEEKGPDGVGTLPFDVRVNGRLAGALRLTVHPGAVGVTGRITHLEIAPGDRRRGRATVAVLAAEEVLRTHGCREVSASVPAGTDGALELAGALGFTERSRSMIKHLPDRPPALPEGQGVRPLTEAEYPRWADGVREQAVRSLTEHGVARQAAVAQVAEGHARLLPDGLGTEHTTVRILLDGRADVGSLWVSTAAGGLPDGADAYVFSVEVDEGHRGRGHGRALMREAERLTHEAGGRLLGLHVSATNAPALRLYDSLGYRVAERHLYKSLG